MILVIDNYDSFTYNLVQYLGELGAEILVKRNDVLSLDDITQLKPEKILLSPGPGEPSAAGICLSVINHFATTLPIFGVCLGMQALALAFGGKIKRAHRVMHGKLSPVYHDNQGVFAHCPNPCQATRYHSLIVEHESLPDCFTLTAWTEMADGHKEVMGIKHKSYPLEGVQFHPESIMTPAGKQLLKNFIDSK